jgi:hypothetical protein
MCSGNWPVAHTTNIKVECVEFQWLIQPNELLT